MNDCVKARKRVLMLLTDHDRTESELREKLEKAGFEPTTIEDAIQYAYGYGYIDDHRYAVHYIERFLEMRSRERVRFDLMKKGLSSELISQAMEEVGEVDQSALIRMQALKKKKTLRGDDPTADKRKLIQSFVRKGFALSEVLHVVEEFEIDEDA